MHDIATQLQVRENYLTAINEVLRIKTAVDVNSSGVQMFKFNQVSYVHLCCVGQSHLQFMLSLLNTVL